MATLLEVYETVLSEQAQGLRNRTMAATLTAAGYIMVEDDQTVNHAARLAWAQATLASLESLRAASDRMYMAVAGNGTIQQAGLAATDNDLNYVVASSIDTIYAAG